jgi:hypothetical protein
MTKTDLLRSSRDGDQFHYHWAARQSLKLLRPGTRLVALAIEGVSEQDTTETAGEEVIDLAEYWGSTDLAFADAVIYRQLKHSTVNPDKEWTISWLKKTLIGFAKKFKTVLDEQPAAANHLNFEFISNRPASDSVFRALEDIRQQHALVREPAVVEYVKAQLTGILSAAQMVEFFRRFTIDDRAPHLLQLRHLFQQDLSALLPGAPGDDHLLLKEMVASRASSLAGHDPLVRRETVLSALKTSDDQLLPAPNLITSPAEVIVTDQVGDIRRELEVLTGRPMIVHSAGGVGKTVLANELASTLPPGSVTLVYDCFGNGGYRRASSPRHEHRQGLVQLSNELAAAALCDPVIPSATASGNDYARIFMKRVTASAEALGADQAGALLVLVIDAADNAALIAHDTGTRSFVAELLREELPDNVRLLMLCRTERVHLLNPPPGYRDIPLHGFGVAETKRHLESVYPTVSDIDAAEFHRRTGGNPRVQALVLESAVNVDEALASLGEAKDVDSNILDGLLQQLVDKSKDTHLNAAEEIDAVCTALAALRPRIPIRVLAVLCNVQPALIRSFVADLGRPLLVDGDALQFRDEPTETWFRKRFRPTGDSLDDFVEMLKPLADSDPYVAVSLPQLLWEAGRVEDLVELALSDEALPQGSDLERQEIAEQRAQFAIKATLRAGRNFDAGRLGLKAGALAAGHVRRMRLIRSNTDLASEFLDPQVIEELVAARSLMGDWPGSNLHYEGALLSGAPGQIDYARNRLRSAHDWIYAWVRQAVEQETRHDVDKDDIAELALGLLNTDGATACVYYLSRWTPPTLAFEAGLVVARRLADAGRVEDLEQLAWHGKGLKHLQLAVAQAASDANIAFSQRGVRRIVAMLKRHRQPIRLARNDPVSPGEDSLSGIVWTVAMGLRYQLLDLAEAERIISLYLPQKLGHDAGSRYERGTTSLMRGFALLARVRGERLDTDAIAGPDVVKAKEEQRYQYTQELNDYKANIEPLAPWMELWVSMLVSSTSNLMESFESLSESTFKEYSDYEVPHLLINVSARIAARVLATGSTPETTQRLIAWCERNERHLTGSTLTDIVRVSAPVQEMHPVAVATANLVRTAIDNASEDAESKSDALVQLARATYRFDHAEAGAHFGRAVEITDLIGDDAYARWESLCAIAKPAAAANEHDDRRAYRLSQVAEGLEPYLGDASDFGSALTAMGRLSPTGAIAIASRWRDRRTATLRVLITALATDPDSALGSRPTTALALTPLDEYVPTMTLLLRAIEDDPARGSNLAKVIAEFERSIRHMPEAYASLDAAAAALEIDLEDTLYAPDVRVSVQAQAESPTTQRAFAEDADGALAERKAEARRALAQFDLTTVEGWEAGRLYVEDRDVPLRDDDLLQQAVRVQPAQLAKMLSAFQTNTHFSVYSYDKLIELLVRLPQLPQAVRAEARNLAITVTTRFCRDLTLRRYDPLDLTRLAELTGRPDADYLDDALRSLGSLSEPLSAEGCFALASRLAGRTSPEEAAALFDACADLFCDVAPLDSSDGLYEDLPAAPDSIGHCIAGFLWAALGDPAADTRWRAAHAVKLLVAMGCAEELDAIRDFATEQARTSAFTDQRLVFYEMHALQWLLFALARAATEPNCGSELVRFAPVFKSVLFDRAPHAVMHKSAKDALLALHESGTLEIEDADLETIRRIGKPVAVDEVSSSRWRANRDASLEPSPTEPADSESSADSGPESAEDSSTIEPAEPLRTRFHFFMDFRQYWCERLGEAFGIAGHRIEQLADEVLVDRWNVPYRGKFDEDARHNLSLYAEGSHSYKSAWPKEEDLDFYLATHALYQVAGHLLKHANVYKEPEQDEDEYHEWLRSHIPTRDDGRWLADRRDAPPSQATNDEVDRSTASMDRDEWIYQVTRDQFTRCLFPYSGWVTVWSYSSHRGFSRSESISVRSALVTPSTARALLVALQTAPSVRAFRLPAQADMDDQYAVDGYELTGWIEDRELLEGRDSDDPYAASIRYPPPHPSEQISAQLELVPDEDLRIWSRNGRTAARSTIWNEPDTRYQRDTGKQGDRLDVDRDVLTDMLKLTGRSLIVEVMIERRFEDYPYGVRKKNQDDQIQYLEPYCKFYLFDESGRCFEL